MTVLTSQQRKLLEDACVKGRRASEQAVRAGLSSLAITADRPPAHLSEDDRQLRRGLRAKSRQLGDTGDEMDLLIGECAYEQWHRLLFARFLAENNLLIHPEYRAPVTLEDCEELAESLGEPDGWSVAGRFAAEILPGIFRLDDPCVRLRLAPEGRLALEAIVSSLPADVFVADDALGWVYQYWQKEKKDEVNRSERKIGGADLGPVTQLFTEDYMVRFLLENSLGAWWAARHPDSPLVKEWEYLRVDDNGAPAAGSFEGWPDTVAEVTVMDPCCGSGHFLVEAFEMLWQMRAEDEGLDAVAAQDAVLRDNLFGLELDPRCVQIAMFAVALQAWKAGGGWRELPVPNIACSGIPVKAPVDEWKALAGGDERLENALVRLHILFRDADTLGSLIDPKRTAENARADHLQRSLDAASWDDLAPLVSAASGGESLDPAIAVLGASAGAIMRAADYLTRQYVLIATNPPFVGLERMRLELESFVKSFHPAASRELALVMFERAQNMCLVGGSLAFVMPSEWTFTRAGRKFRAKVLEQVAFRSIVRLGANSFTTPLRVNPLLVIASPQASSGSVPVVDVSTTSLSEKAELIRRAQLKPYVQDRWRHAQDSRLLWEDEQPESTGVVGDFADARNGMSAGDSERFERQHWEIGQVGSLWEYLQSSPSGEGLWDGMSKVVLWEKERGAMAALADSVKHLNHAAQNWRRGKPLWGRRGVVVSQIGARTSLYLGDRFDSSCFAIVPNRESDLDSLIGFAISGRLKDELSMVNPTWKLGSPKTLLQLGLNREECEARVRERFPDGLPEPWSDDPTQWLFEGRPEVATEPLQVSVGRLLGYRWPEQAESDDLDGLADDDGVVCVPSVRGERTAAERLQELLVRAFGGTWSPARTQELLAESGSTKKDLESWLRDDFFKAHCQVFKNRPFIWQVWDGRKDGFSALVHYHRLNRPTLEKLTYSYLGDWIERQTAGVRDDVPGAEERLGAARGLQQKLELILEGEPPYDIYVRWKSLAEQPIGWEPDLNDGVRLNVRPFVEAGVLRSKFNVKWEKDRGKNPDGSDRLNDLHFTHAEKRAARRGSA